MAPLRRARPLPSRVAARRRCATTAPESKAIEPPSRAQLWRLALNVGVPFAGETTVSNERNNTGPPTTARRLYAGATTGQLRTDAPDVAGLAVLGGLEDEGVGVRRTVAFATSARLRTPMHSDAEDGLLVHVDGVKRFALAPPSSYAALARFGTTSGAHDALFRGSDAVVTGELRPGDALYLPRRWLHDVESETPTLSIALRFDLPVHMDF